MSAEPKTRTTAGLVDVLFDLIEKAKAGQADLAQGNLICKATGSLIAVARLQMQYNQCQEEEKTIRFLEDSEGELTGMADRLTALEQELTVIDKALEGEELSAEKEQRLKARRNDLLQERTMLQRSMKKRSG